MRLRLQKYDIKVKYVPGKFQYIADTLSRACNESSMPSDSDMPKDMEYFIHSLVSSLPISDVKLKELRDLNSNDPTMQILHQYSLQGWPAHKCAFVSLRNDNIFNNILTRYSKQRRQILSKLLLPAAWKNFGSNEIQIVPHWIIHSTLQNRPITK